MSKQKIEFPCAAEIKATGEVVSVVREHHIAGIAVYEVHSKRGKLIGDYGRHAVILRPSRG